MRLFVYGTLMSGKGRAGIMEPYADLVGPASLQGDLYAVAGGLFPALLRGEGQVSGELWEAISPGAATELLRRTDMVESYRADREENSLYLRRLVRLDDPAGVQAWTYIWNGGRHGLTPIRSGDWREYAALEAAHARR